MTKVYLLQHVYERDDTEQVKTIGIYSSESSARLAADRLRAQPGFRDHPEGFEIGPYLLDKDYWADGFVTD
jgi:hypothetical protein